MFHDPRYENIGAVTHGIDFQFFSLQIFIYEDRMFLRIAEMPVFSFEKIRGAEISLGPEMKSTGECLGIAKTFNEA